MSGEVGVGTGAGHVCLVRFGGTMTSRRGVKVNALSYAHMTKLLMERPRTRVELSEETGLHVLTIGDYVGAWYDIGVVHIGDWGPDALGRISVPIYHWGPGKDAPRIPKARQLIHKESRQAARERKALGAPKPSVPAEDLRGVFQVCEKQCAQCLFTKARIVSDARAKEVIADCEKKGTYFVCHKGSLAGNNQLCCRGFFDNVETTVTALAKELGLVRYVPVPKVE